MYKKEEDLSKVLKTLKLGIWAYFLLLLFEGALRKWFLPFLATPLLVVRDPIAIMLIFLSWKHGILKFNLFIASIVFLTGLSVSTALVFGHGSLPVALYGARILVIHFPLMFVIGHVFDKEDVEKIGRMTLLIAIPMVVLIALQFYSPQSAWVNRGVGGDTEGAGFSGAMGYFRPPGTFSFTIGNVMFFNFVACYVFYYWLSGTKINKLVLIASSIALLGSMTLSISRTLVFSIGIVFLFSVIAVAGKPKFLLRMFLALIFGALLFYILSQTELIGTSMEAFTYRFDTASKTEGGVGSSLFARFFGAMFDALGGSNELPFFGYGLGMGTNVGAMLLSGEAKFLIAEWEWLRIVGELGFVVGVLLILVRVLFTVHLSFISFQKLKKGDLLPWLLLGCGFVVIIQGQWAQPTVLGFSTLIGGLILASSKKRLNKTNPKNKFLLEKK